MGVRWGLLAEESFREAMVGAVERYFGGRVRRWIYYEGGFVFSRLSVIEVDLLVTDRERIPMEIKSGVSRADIYELWRVSQLYE